MLHDSNLGMFGVEQFVAVLNPPQVAILAVGAIEEKPVVRDGEITARLLMSLTLTCDHRAVDGADADFLRTVRSMLAPALSDSLRREPGARALEFRTMRVWYRVRATSTLRATVVHGQARLEEIGYADEPGRWAKLERGAMQIALAEGEPEDGGVATVDVDDVKAEADRLRGRHRGGHRPRAAQRGAAAGRVRPRREPLAARAGAPPLIRRGNRQDVRFLKDMLRHAFYWRSGGTVEEASLWRYVSGWGRRGDTSVVALEDGFPIAAWSRLFTRDEPGFGFVDEQTPEVAIAVVPSRRGRGIGSELLDALVELAKEQGRGSLSLSVADSPAMHASRSRASRRSSRPTALDHAAQSRPTSSSRIR